MSDSKSLKLDVIVSYLRLAANIVIGLLLVPYMIKYLGKSEYGIMNLVNSIIGYVSILDLGIGQTLIRYISVYRAENEREKENQLVSYSLFTYLIISLVGLCLGILIYIYFGNIFKNLNANEVALARITFVIALLNILLQIPTAAFYSVLAAYSKYSLINIANIIKIFIRTIVIVLVLKLNYGLIGLFIGDFIVNQILGLFYLLYVLLKIKIKIKLQTIDSSTKNEIKRYSFYVFLGIITDQIFWKTDNILLGIFGSAAAIAVYSISANLVVYYITLCSNFSSVFLPRLTALALNDEDNSKTNNFFIKASKYQYMIVFIMLINYIFLGKDFITLWVGRNFIEAYYYGLVVIVPLTIPMFQTTGIQILYAKNKHKVRAIIYLGNAILNILTSIIFIKLYGTIGVAMGTSFAMILGNCIFINLYYRYQFKLSLKEFFSKSCLRTTLSGMPTVIVLIILSLTKLKEVNFINFIIKASIANIVYFYCIFKYSLKEEERKKIFGYLSRVRNIKK